MKNKKSFRPQLITNDPMPTDAPFPRLYSEKLHGICCVIHHDNYILGRSLKPIKNIQFQERFNIILKYCQENNIMLQGEVWMPNAISDDMTHWINSIDLNKMSKTSLKHIDKNIESGKFKLPKETYMSFPNEIKIHVFDMLTTKEDGEYEEYDYEENYVDRYNKLIEVCKLFPEHLVAIPQYLVNNQEEEDKLYKISMEKGYEGGVIRYSKPYKTNRSTAKELLIYKRLPVPIFDGKIITINQGSVVNPEAEKTINELNRSVTSKKLGDRILIEKAKDFQVEMKNEKTGKMINFGVSMKGFNDEARRDVWKNPELFIGRWISFKCKAYEFIGLPKSAVFLKFRDDRDD